MTGFSRGHGVPLHRGPHQLGASTNSSNMLYRLTTVACTGLLTQTYVGYFSAQLSGISCALMSALFSRRSFVGRSFVGSPLCYVRVGFSRWRMFLLRDTTEINSLG